MSEMLRVEVDNGKYTIVQDNKGRLTALRHGEEWRDCVGDNLIYCMAAELEQFRTENAAKDAEIARLKSQVNLLCSVLSKYDDEPHIMSVLNDIPAQSLHDHDMALAEKVREACAAELNKYPMLEIRRCKAAEKVRNLDLTAIVRGEGDEG